MEKMFNVLFPSRAWLGSRREQERERRPTRPVCGSSPSSVRRHWERKLIREQWWWWWWCGEADHVVLCLTILTRGQCQRKQSGEHRSQAEGWDSLCQPSERGEVSTAQRHNHLRLLSPQQSRNSRVHHLAVLILFCLIQSIEEDFRGAQLNLEQYMMMIMMMMFTGQHYSPQYQGWARRAWWLLGWDPQWGGLLTALLTRYHHLHLSPRLVAGRRDHHPLFVSCLQ